MARYRTKSALELLTSAISFHDIVLYFEVTGHITSSDVAVSHTHNISITFTKIITEMLTHAHAIGTFTNQRNSFIHS